MALLNRDGVVVSVNRAWRQFGLANGGTAAVGLGTSYLLVCERAEAAGVLASADAGALIRAAVEGRGRGRHVDYPVDEAASRWFRMQAFPLRSRHAGALVVHSELHGSAQERSETASS